MVVHSSDRTSHPLVSSFNTLGILDSKQKSPHPLCRYQVRCLLPHPIFAKQGQVLSGRVLMQANMKQSYDVTIECQIVGTSTKAQNSLDLKNPYFRYTGVQPQPPPGENHASPSEAFWSQVDMQGARQV